MSSNCYLLELEIINIFNTSTTKIILCKSGELAYEYGLKIEPMIKRNNINPIEKALDKKIIWETDNNFPKYKCKMIPINCDILWELYNMDTKFSLNPYDKHKIVQNIYTNLKINNLV